MNNNYKYVKNSRERLKQRMIYVMGDRCQCCGYNKCQSALEFHHINPEEKDFTLAANANKGWSLIVPELKKCVLVCANCHREIEAGLIQSPNSSFIEERANEISQIINDLKSHKLYYCKNCGKEIYKGSTYCSECSHKLQRKVERPSREELKQLIRTTPFTQIGKRFGVSDNAIKKWCDSMNLPRTKKDINSYSDKEWESI